MAKEKSQPKPKVMKSKIDHDKACALADRIVDGKVQAVLKYLLDKI